MGPDSLALRGSVLRCRFRGVGGFTGLIKRFINSDKGIAIVSSCCAAMSRQRCHLVELPPLPAAVLFGCLFLGVAACRHCR